MSELIKVMQVSDLDPGTMKTVMVSGRNVAVANVDGEFFAIDDTCSHEECSLGTEGALDGSTVICGCHGAMFDVTNGAVMALPAPADVASYPVVIQDGVVYVAI